MESDDMTDVIEVESTVEFDNATPDVKFKYRPNRMPHQGVREKLRRVRQAERLAAKRAKA